LLPLEFLLLSCQPPHAAPPREQPAPVAVPATPLSAPVADAVVLVVVDGVRWQEVFQGVDPKLAADAGISKEEVVGAEALLPTLHGIVGEHGVLAGQPLRGESFVASGPNFVSLPGYTEIFGGRVSTKCGDNHCEQTLIPTLLDDVRARTCEHDEEVAVFSSWESIPKAASARPGTFVVSSGRRLEDARLRGDPQMAFLLDRGRAAAPWPGSGEYRPDEYTSRVALRYLERAKPRFMFVGLGDTDEYAHHGDYARYVGALRRADGFVRSLLETLERMGERGRRTAVFVTTDHGRSASFRDHGGFAPESARVWLGAVGAGIAKNADRISGSLADIAPTARKLLGLPRASRFGGEGSPLEGMIAFVSAPSRP
jgi:hypothetical protein